MHIIVGGGGGGGGGGQNVGIFVDVFWVMFVYFLKTDEVQKFLIFVLNSKP